MQSKTRFAGKLQCVHMFGSLHTVATAVAPIVYPPWKHILVQHTAIVPVQEEWPSSRVPEAASCKIPLRAYGRAWRENMSSKPEIGLVLAIFSMLVAPVLFPPWKHILAQHAATVQEEWPSSRAPKAASCKIACLPQILHQAHNF